MDILTSTVIRRGGSVRSKLPKLAQISPYLDSRLLGVSNLNIQESIKQVFDPNDVLAAGQMFDIEGKAKQSWLEKARASNKQINYIATCIEKRM